MKSIKDIRRKIYGILNPAYREIKRLFVKLDTEHKQYIEDVIWLKNTVTSIRNEQQQYTENIGALQNTVTSIRNEQQQYTENIDALQNTVTSIKDISLETNKMQKDFISQNFYDKCSKLFLLKDSDENYKRDLCAKFLLMAQDDIVKNMCNYVIRNKQFLIFDIGANKGDVSKIMLDNVNTKNSFVFGYEPIIEMNPYLDALKQQFNNFDYKMIGIGNKKDNLTLKYNSAISGLTSFLKFKNDYKYFTCNPKDCSIQEDLYNVDINTLDSEYFDNEKFKGWSNIALKIDVQGFELNVLKGCEQLFDKQLIKTILIECTTVQKYETAATYEEIFDYLHEKGFVIFDMLPVYREINGEFHQDNKGHLTEFDAIFVLKSFIEENKV